MDTQQQAIEFVMSLAKEHHNTDVDVVLGRRESKTVRVRDAKVEKVDQSTAQGLGIRVLEEGRTGLSYTERLDSTAIERAFLAARENAKLMDPTEVVMNKTIPQVPDPATLETYNPALDALTLEDLATFGLEMEAAAKNGHKSVKNVPHAGVTISSGMYRIVSTYGADYIQYSNNVQGGCSVLLEDGDRRKSGGHGMALRHWEPQKASEIGRIAAEKGGALLPASKIPGGPIPIVLDEEVAPQLLGMYFGAFSAEAAQKGQSRLAGRLGEQIAGEDITIVDDPHRLGALASRYLDAEGTLTKPLTLIDKGRFNSFRYHIESAKKEGRESTGHGSRGTSGGVSTSSHSLVLETGSHTLEQLTALPKRCLLVTELEGAAGCNPLSGDISIGVQGFLVENGERVHPVDSVTIAGNFFDLLKTIQARGDRYQPDLATVFFPALLLDGLTVAS